MIRPLGLLFHGRSLRHRDTHSPVVFMSLSPFVFSSPAASAVIGSIPWVDSDWDTDGLMAQSPCVRSRIADRRVRFKAHLKMGPLVASTGCPGTASGRRWTSKKRARRATQITISRRSGRFERSKFNVQRSASECQNARRFTASVRL